MALALIADGAHVLLSAPHESTAAVAVERLTQAAMALRTQDGPAGSAAWAVADNADPATPGSMIPVDGAPSAQSEPAGEHVSACDRIRRTGNRSRAPGRPRAEPDAGSLDGERRPQMRGIISARQVPRPGVRALSAAGAVIALAGCGSAVAGGAGQPTAGQGQPRATAAAVPLCTSARRPDQVVVRLTAPQAREILPRAITITDAAQVRALAAALCGLPPLPGGVRHCPAALPGALRLEFTAGRQAYRPLLIRDSGCASVTGIGPVRQWTWSSRPGRLLRVAAGSHGRLIPGTYPSSVPVG